MELLERTGEFCATPTRDPPDSDQHGCQEGDGTRRKVELASSPPAPSARTTSVERRDSRVGRRLDRDDYHGPSGNKVERGPSLKDAPRLPAFEDPEFEDDPDPDLADLDTTTSVHLPQSSVTFPFT